MIVDVRRSDCGGFSAVIPQHGGDSSVSSTNEELKPAVYYERLKILRQRQGLENTSRVGTHASPQYLSGLSICRFSLSYFALFMSLNSHESLSGKICTITAIN